MEDEKELKSPPRPLTWGRLSWLGAGYAGLLLVAVAGGHPPEWETSLVRSATHIPAILGEPLSWIMQLGTKTFLPVVALAVFWLTRWVRLSVAVLVGGLVEALLNSAAKELAERPRPDDVTVSDPAGGFGFPSGHTAMAFFLAAVLAPHLSGRWTYVPYAVAALVGLARMHVGVHYLSDVVGGALWGLLVGWAVTTWVRQGVSRATARETP